MPKKRLTDLLREEAEKSSEAARNHPVNPMESPDDLTDLSPDQSAENIAQVSEGKESDSRSDPMKRNRPAVPSVSLTELQAAWELERIKVEKLETELKQAQARKEDLEKAQQNLQEDLQAAQSRIKQVEAELKKANQRYEKLETTHADLKNELAAQKTQVKQLQTELKSSEKIQLQLKSELETVSQTARLFSEENQSLKRQITALEQENQALKNQGGRLVYQPNNSMLAKDKFLYNPLSNEDIGWFD